MRKVLLLAAVSLAVFAEPAYKGIASVKQLMLSTVKPAMDSNAAMNKAGGPKDDAEWAVAAQNAAVIGEMMQLIQFAGRPKDEDLWAKSSARSLAAAEATLKAAEAKDVEAWKKASAGIGGGCRSCHDVHKPKKT